MLFCGASVDTVRFISPSCMHKQFTGDLIKCIGIWRTRLRRIRTVLAIMIHKTRNPDAQGILNNGAA